MGKFVNYKKRAVTLPAGFKDLADLLQNKTAKLPRAKASGSKSGGLKENPVNAPLSEVGTFIDRLNQSRSSSAGFVVHWRTESRECTIHFERIGKDEILAYTWVEEGTEFERIVRAFLSRHGLEPQKPPEPEAPQKHSASVQMFVRFELGPLSKGAGALAMLTAAFFRETCGVTDNCEVTFIYYESGKAKPPASGA